MNEVLEFCVSVGLPVCLADIGVDSMTEEELAKVAELACIPEESIHAMPFPITEEAVAAAIIVADQLGQAFKQGRN